MYRSKSLEAIHQLDPADRKHTIQVLKELIASPKVTEDDRAMYQRFLADRDPFAPKPPEHPMIVAFRKRWQYLN
jgi:hypothetical protein